MLASVLWELLREQRVQSLSTDGSAGHEFEDVTVEKVYTACHRLGALKVFPPRYTLKLPTVSGLHHQIDVVVQEGTSGFHLVECKFRQSVTIEELYATNGKLLDYVLGAQVRGQKTRLRGYYLVGPTRVNDSFYQYALAWGITLIAPDGPAPLEHMLAKTRPDTALYGQLTRLLQRTSGAEFPGFVTKPCKPHQLLVEWRACYERWKREGYEA